MKQYSREEVEDTLASLYELALIWIRSDADQARDKDTSIDWRMTARGRAEIIRRAAEPVAGSILEARQASAIEEERPRERCRKCGSTEVGVSFHRSGSRCGYGDHSRNTDLGEHLHWYCQVCRFDWTGPTLDEDRDAGK